MNKLKLSINNLELEVDNGTTILQACESVGVVVPRFCYHEKLSVAGNCRMCLVEVGNKTPDGKLSMIPKLQASCAIPVTNGMVVLTESVSVKKAREGIMELLLVNHPLDCPICDQGGECDLQDQSMTYGSDHGRLFAASLKPSDKVTAMRVRELNGRKRAVKDKNLGPLIKTIMTRCIHCTRCVRFASEVAGCADMGTIGRGNNLEIARSAFDTSKQKLSAEEVAEAELNSSIAGALLTEVSGNLIDICPVGALTSAPYAFTARPWELRSIESVDMSDSYGSKIRADVRGSIMRILPSKVLPTVGKLSAEHNTELYHNRNSVLCNLPASGWISDKTRFSYDGLKRQRINLPMTSSRDAFIQADKSSGSLANSLKKGACALSWEEAIGYAASLLCKEHSSDRNLAIIGSTVDVEGLTMFKTKLASYFSQIAFTEACSVHSTVSESTACTSAVGELTNSFGKLMKEQVCELNSIDLTNLNASATECMPSLLWYKKSTQVSRVSQPDLVLLVGCNPRMEATGLNLDLQELGKRLRKQQRPFQIASVGAPVNLSYPVKHLGTSLSCLNSILDGKHSYCKELQRAINPLIIVGSSVLKDDSLFNRLLEWCNEVETRHLLVLHNTPAHTSALTVGFEVNLRAKIPVEADSVSTLLLWNVHPNSSKVCVDALALNYDNKVELAGRSLVNFCLNAKASGTKIVYVGSHGNELAAMADVVLPAAAFTEREGSVVNTLGFVQRTRVITAAPGQAREEWSIFKALAETISPNTTSGSASIERRQLTTLATYVPASLAQWTVYSTSLNEFASSIKKNASSFSQKSLTKSEAGESVEAGLCKIRRAVNFPTLAPLSLIAQAPKNAIDRRKLAVLSSLTGNIKLSAQYKQKTSSQHTSLSPLHTTIDNYYLTDQVSANSTILTKASKGLLLRSCAYSAAADRYLPTIFQS